MSISATTAAALNEATHELINEHTAQVSSLSEYLRRQLGLRDGIEAVVHDREVIGWLGEGGRGEDDGSLFFGTARYLRHFHDPLKPWRQAGLSSLLVGNFVSSIAWMERLVPREQCGVWVWSWHDVRCLYWTGLPTRTRESDRKPSVSPSGRSGR